MSKLWLDGREVENEVVCGKGVDTFIESAQYADTGDALSEDELDRLQENNSDFLVLHNMERFGYYAK